MTEARALWELLRVAASPAVVDAIEREVAFGVARLVAHLGYRMTSKHLALRGVAKRSKSLRSVNAKIARSR